MLFEYVLLVDQDAGLQDIAKKASAAIGADAEETVMTLGERLIEEGKAIGLEEGLEQGKAIGLEEGRESMLRTLRTILDRRGVEISEAIETRLAEADHAQIEAWLVRAVEHAKAEEIFLDG